MVIRIVYLFLILLFTSCEELDINEDSIFEADPSEQIPDVTYVGETINGSSADFSWEGNDFALEFSYMVEYYIDYADQVWQPYNNWSDWTTNHTTYYNDLDEGNYTFYVRSRFGLIEEQEPYFSTDFEIDAIVGPALRIYPLRQKVGGEDSFYVYLYVENIDDIAGLQVELQFNSDQIVFIGSPDNCGLESNSFCPELDDSRITILNWNINGDFNSDSPIAQLSFNRLRNEDTEIIISGYTLRNSNNDDIPVDYVFNGIIEKVE